jgi:uncharacterized protein (TIGR00369 family)
MDSIPKEQILDLMKVIYEENMPFNKYLGLKIDTISAERVVVRIDMQDDLIGNFEKKILHGGVISTILDFIGGVIAHRHVLNDMKDVSLEKLIKRFTSMGTIDMRIDYMRPVKGLYFFATGHILRLGHKVAVARTEFVNEEGVLIAVGTSTYTVG